MDNVEVVDGLWVDDEVESRGTMSAESSEINPEVVYVEEGENFTAAEVSLMAGRNLGGLEKVYLTFVLDEDATFDVCWSLRGLLT